MRMTAKDIIIREAARGDVTVNGLASKFGGSTSNYRNAMLDLKSDGIIVVSSAPEAKEMTFALRVPVGTGAPVLRPVDIHRIFGGAGRGA